MMDLRSLPDRVLRLILIVLLSAVVPVGYVMDRADQFRAYRKRIKNARAEKG